MQICYTIKGLPIKIIILFGPRLNFFGRYVAAFAIAVQIKKKKLYANSYISYILIMLVSSFSLYSYCTKKLVRTLHTTYCCNLVQFVRWFL